MKNLKSLNFSPLPRSQLNNPVIVRRGKLIRRLEEQKAALQDPLYMAVEQRWEKTPEGRKELVERKRKVRRWWQEDVTGNVYLTIRYGQKMIEFEKGKAAIAVPNKDGLNGVFDVLISAVRGGELDEALTTMSKARGFKKKAA